MKIDEAGMNGLILGLPLGGVLAHAGSSATVVEPPASSTTPPPSGQASSTRNSTRPILWLAMGTCVAAVAWTAFQGEVAVNPTPEPTIPKPPVQPQKIEQIEVPTLEPLPPLTNNLTEHQIVADMNEPATARPPAVEDQKQVTETKPIQKKAIAVAPQHIKTHPAAAAPIGSPKAKVSMPAPAPALPLKETRPSAATLAPEKIDGAAIGIISATNDKLIMSVDGSFRAFRPGQRLPFNEVLVSVRNGTITTDRRVFELVQP